MAFSSASFFKRKNFFGKSTKENLNLKKPLKYSKILTFVENEIGEEEDCRVSTEN